MSFAIEVLKRLVKEEGLKMSGNEMIYFNKDEFNALKEALLALEQREKLIEWLEKEIEIIKQTQEEYGNKVLHEEIRKNILKEVLESLKKNWKVLKNEFCD